MKDQEEQFVAIARKYIPDLSPDAEQLVRDIANCKAYSIPQKPNLFAIFPTEECNCLLCLRITIWKLNRQYPTLNLSPTPFDF